MTRNEELAAMAAMFEAMIAVNDPNNEEAALGKAFVKRLLPESDHPLADCLRAIAEANVAMIRAIAAVYRQAAERGAKEAAIGDAFKPKDPWALPSVPNIAVGVKFEELPEGFVSWGGPYAELRKNPLACGPWNYRGGPPVNPNAAATPLESERDCGCPAGECLNKHPFSDGHNNMRIGFQVPNASLDDGRTVWSCGRVTQKG
jgi:hypothetical protein